MTKLRNRSNVITYFIIKKKEKLLFLRGYECSTEEFKIKIK
jgi:hypothetical protein